jgi:hypothetical protein
MKRFLVGTAALVAAVVVLVAVSLPPRRLGLAAPADGTIPGILHVHTNRSDGRSSPDEVAAAAARAGLRFLVFTDHGDATRQPDPPTYRSGVLCLDGVEISTTGGHYVALDMPASPYPLGGEARDVVEDVRRLGGFGIAAHPDSPKPELRWREWDAPFDGIELLNPDTSWRVWAQQAGRSSTASSADKWRARRQLALSLLDYPFRPAETIARLMQAEAPTSAVGQWAAIAARRRVVAVAGIDAHAMLAYRGDPGDGGTSLPLPGYEPSFRVLSVHVTPDSPLSGDAVTDASRLVRALRNGHLYVAVDGIATPASLEFSAANEHGTVHEGDEIAVGGPVTLRVRSNAPPAFTTAVWAGNRVFSGDHHEPEFAIEAPADPAVYWVEIRSAGGASPMPWVRSNAIYVRGPERPPAPAAGPPASANSPIFDGTTVAAWRTEHDALSAAAVELAGSLARQELRFRFGLAGGSPVGQYAALVYDVPANGFVADRVTFRGRAERPMRISVQLRGGDGVVDRWQRSVFLDTFEQERTVYFDDCLPVGVTKTERAPLSSIRSVMFVVDTTNSKPGTQGRTWIRRAALQNR